jgi:uncharacterized protein (TIGR03435 family)
MTNHIAGTVAVALVLFGSPQIRAQSQASPPPAFDVVSVKPNKSATASEDSGIRITAGRLTATRVNLLALISKAYDIPVLLIYGGPSWVSSEAFDVEAKTNSPADEDQVKKMLQTLLANQFQLRVLRRMREVAVSHMTMEGRPSKLTKPKEGETSSLKWTQVSITGQKVTMADVAGFLTRALRQVVIDKTGLEDEFDFKIDNTPGALPWTQLTDLALVLERELGLQVASHKGPVETLVIDLAVRPPTN